MVEAHERWEDNIGTVLFVVHDLQPGDNEGIYDFRKSLDQFREPVGKYNKIYIRSKHDPKEGWTA